MARLDRQAIAIARDETRVIGFMTLEPGGYIDFAYIRPKAQRTGLFRRYSRRSKRRPSLRTNRGFGSMPA